MHWLESEPVFRDYLAARGVTMVLAFRQADILRLPRYGEYVDVRTSIFERGSFLGYRNTVLYGEDGVPCVLTWSVGAFTAQDTGRIARLPPEVTESITLDERVDMTYLDKKIMLPNDCFTQLQSLPVRRCDIDLNGHMNNARYIEAALELLPEDFMINRLRIEYRSSAMPGGVLYPSLCETGGAFYLVLSDGGGRPYTVMEFS